MPIDKIIAAMLMIGSDLPAFRALFDEVVQTFGHEDQAKLQALYTQAKADSDKAHAAAQALGQ